MATAAAPTQSEASQHEKRKEELEAALSTAFGAMNQYLTAELTTSTDELVLLRDLNTAAKQKYSGMADNTAQLVKYMSDLKEKYDSLAPYLAKVDEVDRSVTELEQTVASLDDYTKRIEVRFKKVVRELKATSTTH